VTRGVLLTFFPALLLQTWNDFLILFFPIEREHSMAGDKKSGNFSSYFEGIAQDSTPWKLLTGDGPTDITWPTALSQIEFY
jgi:hypothetical protein